MAEIEAQFDGEWVMVGDPELTPQLEVVRGQVLCHSADPGEFHRAALEFRDGEIKHFATLYVGQAPEEMRFLL